MKTSNIFWGTVFIVLGLLFLLVNFSALNLDWDNIWQFWPIIIILLGFSILVKHLGGSTNDYSSKEYRETFDSSIKNAVLKLDGGAAKINIESVTSELINVKTECAKTNFSVNKSDSDGSTLANLTFNQTSFLVNNFKCSSNINIALNENPLWKLYFSIGAASTRLDLAKLKVEDITMKMGAAKLDVKLGSLAEYLKFNISSGVSQINISVPEKVGCEVITGDVVSKKNILGFNNISSRIYRTDGYENSDKKIAISIDCSVSSIYVRRY